MEDRLRALEEKFSELTLKLQDLIGRVEKLESSEKDTGVYLDGCPEYVADYINKGLDKKEGE